VGDPGESDRRRGPVCGLGPLGQVLEFGRRNQPWCEALDFIGSAVKAAGYDLGKEVLIALDCASSEYFKGDRYAMAGEGR